MTRPELSLDSLTLTDVSPVALIDAAQHAGFDCVSLWLQPPPVFPAALVCAANERECARALADADLRVTVLEVFELASPAAVESYRDAIERGARLGAATALAVNYSNPDRGETADLLARMAEVAGECGLAVNLEPIAGGRTATLEQGAAMIAASGADVGLTFDAWHLMGTGGSVVDLAAADPALIRYVQLCDAPSPFTFRDCMAGLVSERAYPGDGGFPLAEMLRLLPDAVPYGIECPSVRRAREGRSPREQACEALAAMHRTLALREASGALAGGGA